MYLAIGLKAVLSLNHYTTTNKYAIFSISVSQALTTGIL